jgi:hypothetical protein
MNRKYYGAIYLDQNPSPLDYSLLDTDEIIPNNLINKPSSTVSKSLSNFELKAWESEIFHTKNNPEYTWVSCELELITKNGIENGRIVVVSLKDSKIVKQKIFRLTTPFSKDQKKTMYNFHYKSPKHSDEVVIKLESLGKLKVKKATYTLNFYN